MSHFLGTPTRSRIWALAESKNSTDTQILSSRLLSGPTVDFYLGSGKRHWSIHAKLLAYHTSYCDITEQTRGGPIVHLPDDDPSAFELLVKWLYQGKMDDVHEVSDEQKYQYAVLCHKLWKLCDRLGISGLKNQAMDRYRQNLHEAQLVPDSQEINEIYRSSPPKSPFRRLMAHIAARQIMDPDVEKDAETYRCCFIDNPDFAIEMMNAIRRTSAGMLLADPTGGEQRTWHDLGDTVPRGVKPSSLFEDAGKRPVECDENGPISNAAHQDGLRQQSSIAFHAVQSETEQSASEAALDPMGDPKGQHEAHISSPVVVSTESRTFRKRPRKLTKSSSEHLSDSDSTLGIVNGSRKVFPAPNSSHLGDTSTVWATWGRADECATPKKAVDTAGPPSSLRRLHKRNYVNRMVHQLNDSNNGTSGDETSGDASGRRPSNSGCTVHN